MNEADKGNLEVTRGVANWRIAATRVPPQKSFLGERHASKAFKALSEVEVLGKDCDNIRSPHFVQNVVSFSQEVRIGLTVSAIANAPVHQFLGVTYVALQITAPAS